MQPQCHKCGAYATHHLEEVSGIWRNFFKCNGCGESFSERTVLSHVAGWVPALALFLIIGKPPSDSV